MNPIAQILWDAAADVEQRGVTHLPITERGETCATLAISDARGSFHHGTNARRVLLAAAGAPSGRVITEVVRWNDAQPSRAVVAAAMRDAAFLAEWAGPHLLAGSE